MVNAQSVAIHELDAPLAKAAGQLCAATGSTNVVAASVVLLARLTEGIAVTSDPDDQHRIDPDARGR